MGNTRRVQITVSKRLGFLFAIFYTFSHSFIHIGVHATGFASVVPCCERNCSVYIRMGFLVEVKGWRKGFGKGMVGIREEYSGRGHSTAWSRKNGGRHKYQILKQYLIQQDHGLCDCVDMPRSEISDREQNQ
ncbi:hypothetical protein B0T25DRAFT_78024 [Lasiosphaeria hispida]|uniref:Uncharacterized protein n=1 Tax=Lasiosphaeria hispida TaxID=260671 RepID=A0AAJ0HPL7_9PEZI|nr:hypothetical protein B0T25DRAFT_78024 [Lasiosphaeria hispida]